MEKFKVGDRVRVIDTKRLRWWPYGKEAIGWETTLTIPRTVEILNSGGEANLGDNRYGINFNAESLVKTGGSMNKHEDLKTRIELLKNGWNKDADDILEEINKLLKHSCYRLSIPCWISSSDGIQILQAYGMQPYDVEVTFKYDTQCEKLKAFKKALLWLLDHSDIKKVDQERVDKIEDLQRQLDELKRGI